ncbi:hypothetical protein NS115_24865, partial [Paenibacillus jamilae]
VGNQPAGIIVGLVECLEVGDFGACRLHATGVRAILAGVEGLGRILGAIIAVVIEQAAALRRGASDLREHARITIGRRRSVGVRIDDALAGDLGEVAAEAAFDPTLQIDGVHAVDTDQQDMLVAMSPRMPIVIVRMRHCDAASEHGRRDRGSRQEIVMKTTHEIAPLCFR